MAQPYPMDLRQRVSAAACQAAAHFGIAMSTAITWVKRFRQTGSAKPGQMDGHKPKAIRGVDRDWLIVRCAAGDFTLRGLVAELAERGPAVGYGAVGNLVHAEKLSFKNVEVLTWSNGHREPVGMEAAEPPAVVVNTTPLRCWAGYRGILQCDGCAAHKQLVGSAREDATVTPAFCLLLERGSERTPADARRRSFSDTDRT
jgi:transposase